MIMLNNERKYGDKAVIEPARVIEERKKIGLHPSCPVHSGNGFVKIPQMLNVMAG
jgi:hypothetical protein